MASTLPTGGELTSAFVRDHLYNFDKECFIDKLSTSSQNGCSAAYSTRLLRSNYYGPMVRVRRSTDNAEQDFYGDTFGKLGIRIYGSGTSLTSWLGAATGHVVILYDQSGNVRNVTQTTNANQPTISSSGITYSGSQWLQLTNTQIPSAAMTANSSGGLVASASAIYSGEDAWKAFDFNSATYWHSSLTYNSTNGLYTGPRSTTDVNGIIHSGEWLQLQLASSIKLNAFTITPRGSTAAPVRSPRNFVILGSNNGTSWNVLHEEFNRTNWTPSSQTFTIVNSVSNYSYYRIVIKRVGNLDSDMGGSNSAQIAEWLLNPTTVPLAAGDDTYTYYATWTPTVNATAIVCEQTTTGFPTGSRAALITLDSLRYGFNGSSNDAHFMVAYATNIKRRTVMMCNHTLATGNVEIYDEGVLYKGTSTAPANLSVGTSGFSIGRNIGGAEYFTGKIDEIIITNNTALEREALLYFTPTLLTKPKELFPKPKRMITFTPLTDNPTPSVGGGLASIAITNLNLDLINVGNGTAVSDWNGYAQATAGNRPVYYDRGGLSNDMGYINFNRANGQHLNGGSRTLNIATNGGLVVIALIKFTGTAGSFERIIDFGNGQANNNILFARSGTTSNLYFDNFNGGTIVGSITATNAIVQDEWAVYAMRYNGTTRFAELYKNGILLNSTTYGTALSDRTITTAYVGRSHWADAYLNAQMGGLYVLDRYISNNEMVALGNSLITYSLPNIPRHISDLNSVYTSTTTSPAFIPTRTGWSGFFDGTVGNFLDVQDVPNLPMSYSYWFNAPDVTTNYTIVGLCDLNRGSPRWGIQHDFSNGNMDFYCALPSPWTSYTGYPITANTWYHVTICVNTSYQVIIYVNGSLLTTLTGTDLMPARSRFVIGAAGDSARGYRGYIQDFRVYDYILRADEVSKIYDGVSMQQLTLQAPTNYLVNVRNWYSIMSLGKAGSPYTGAYVAQLSGSDPNSQYQLVNSTVNVNNYLYHYQRIQDYKSFTCSFEIYTSGLDGTYGGGDQMYFFIGATSLPVYENVYNSSNYVDFQVYTGSGNANRGVAFFRNGTRTSQSHYSQYIGASRWVPVSITYNRGNTDATWVVNMNGQDIITYIDTNNETWRSASGNYWGVGAWVGGANMTAYIRRVELTYVPQASSILNRGLTMNSLKRFPEGPLSANSSQNCVASASTEYNVSGTTFPAWKAFDFTPGDGSVLYQSAWSLYNSTTGAYIGGVSTTVSGVSYSGEWLQIQLPRAIRLFSYTITCRTNYVSSQSPNTWVIAGSNDGTTWTLVDTETNVSTWNSLRLSFNVNNSGIYRYFRMICTVTGQAASSDRQAFVVSEWELYSLPFSGVKYPIAAMTSDTTTFAGTSLGSGTYKTTYSSTWISNDFYGWRAFTHEANDSFHIVNNVAGTGFYSGTNGTYNGAVSTTISGSNVLGEWLQIELPHPIRLTRYSLLSRIGIPAQSAQTWKIAGSNDNSTWTEVDSESGITGWANNVVRTFSTSNSTVAYKYYRMVTTQIESAAGEHWSQREWMLYDDTTSTINLYGKTIGLIEGLTWKYYNGYLADNMSAFDSNSYRHIGITTNLSSLSAATNGQYYDNCGDLYSIEWTGYFRANVTGTWTFQAYSDDSCYVWIGQNGLSGYTTSNYLLYENSGHPGTRTNTIYLIEGVYYPFRMRWGESLILESISLNFTPPGGTQTFDGTGYFFSSIGTNQAYPGESAKVIKEISQTNIDGIYYINVNGVSTATYCLMNDIYDGGGWMMLMKATRGGTFQYSANYWTTANTLNPGETNRNDGDAKFDTFNYTPIKDVLAIWPDISSTAYTNVYGKNGGSLLLDDGWTWKIDNWYDVTLPPYGLTANGQTLNDITYTVSSGTAFGVSGQRENWRAFNYLLTDGEEWHSLGGIYDTNNGNYIGTSISTVVDGSTVYGDYLQIQMSSEQYIDRIGLYPRPGYFQRCPKSFILAGSTNGSSWTSLYQITDSGTWSNNWKYFTLSSLGIYSYYRIIIRNVFAGGDSVQIGEMRFFGNARSTALNGFQRTRDAHPNSPFLFNGFSSGIFPAQEGASRHVFGGGSHVFGYLPPYRPVRWGFLFNNEADFLTNDVGGGIGVGTLDSAGGFGGGISRTARVEVYGR